MTYGRILLARQILEQEIGKAPQVILAILTTIQQGGYAKWFLLFMFLFLFLFFQRHAQTIFAVGETKKMRA